MLTPIMRPIMQPVLVPVDYEYGDVLNPLSLFAADALDFWYDPSDFSTLYQDAAGTTPVTAFGQPVGLTLDKRNGVPASPFGPQLVTNGDFSQAGTGWTTIDTAPSVTTFTGGAATMTAAPGSALARLRQGLTVPAGTYIVTLDVVSITGSPSGALSLGNTTSGDVAYGTISLITTGSKVAIINVTGPTLGLAFTAASAPGGTLVIDNVSVRAFTGNHAYQTTALSRPTVQSGYNAFDKTDDHLLGAAGGGGTTGFLLACGVVVPAAGTARTIFSDRGTNAGYKLGIDATNKVVFSGGTGAGHTTLTSANALTTGQKYAVIAWHDGTNLNLSINGVPEPPVACGTVTAGTSTLTIGKDNGSASGYWGDSIYTAVYRRNDSSSAAQRSGLYTYIVGKMGGL